MVTLALSDMSSFEINALGSINYEGAKFNRKNKCRFQVPIIL